MTDDASILPRHPLAIGRYRLYLLARLTTMLAQTGVALIVSWQAYNIARETMPPGASAAQLGLIGLIQFAVLFVATPWSGWAADNISRRAIGIATLGVQFSVAMLLAIMSYNGGITLPLLFAIAAALGLARAFQGPAMSALAPNLVPAPLLPQAIALSSMVWQGAAIIGPALAGTLYALFQWGAYALSAVLLLLAVGAVLMLGEVPQAARDRARKPIRQIMDGIAYVRGNRLVLGAITLDLFAVLLAGTTALLPVYARDILQVGASGLGWLAAAPGVGAAIMALWFSIRPMSHNVGIKMLIAVSVFGGATILFGLTAFMPAGIGFIVAIGAMLIWGAADMVSVFVRQSLVQIHTPDAMRGRVSSVSMMTISASNELGEAESGFLAALIGPVAAVIAGGIGAIAVTLIWARRFPELALATSFDPPDVARDRRDAAAHRPI